MKVSISITFLSAALFSGATELLPSSDAGIKTWQHKTNTSITAGEDGCCKITVDTPDYNYGWISRKLDIAVFPSPESAGIYGRFRAAAKISGSLSAYLIVPATGKPIYYQQRIDNLNTSNGEWIEFYLPFKEFTRSGLTLRKSVLTNACKLQLSLSSVEGGSITFDLDRLRYLTKEEAAITAPLIQRKRTARQLRPSDKVTGPSHPRLLLTPKRIDRIKEKIKSNPDVKYVYEKFIAYADESLKSYPAENPFSAFKTTLDNSATQQEKHRQRAQIEGMLVRGARPIEILAAAYMITGDERYGRHAAQALVNAARTVDHNNATLNDGFYYTRTFLVRALAFGYDWLWNLLTPEERRDVKTTLLGFAQSIHNESWTASWGNKPLKRVWNWNPGLVSAAGLAMLALEGETTTAEKNIIFELRRHLRDYLTLGIDPDGCGHEGPVYIGYGIGAGPEFAECLRDQGRGDLFLDTNLKKVVPWFASEALPDHKRWNNLSDCSHHMGISSVLSYTFNRIAELSDAGNADYPEALPPPDTLTEPIDFLVQFSENPGDRKVRFRSHESLLGWLWEDGLATKLDNMSSAGQLAFLIFYEPCKLQKSPEKILPEAVHFRGRGLAISRSGFKKDDIYLAVEAGPHAAGHDQSDKGSFTLYGYGADLAIDSGYGNDGDTQKSGSSYAHNMVLINGKGQPMKWHNQSSGAISGYHHSPLIDWIRVDASDAWNFKLGRDLEAIPQPEPVEKANRTFVFVREGKSNPPYLVVMDDIRKNNKPAEYTWLWHTSPEMRFSTKDGHWECSAPIDRECQALTSSAENPKGSAKFTFNVKETGFYKLCGLVRAAPGQPTDKADSFFVKINGEKRSSWHLRCGNRFGVSAFAPDNAAEPRIFELKKGETFEVVISVREPYAQLAQLSLIKNDEESAESIVIKAGEAQLLNPALEMKTVNTDYSEGAMAVFPVTTPAGNVKTTLYETSKQGFHPRLEHTVKAVEPRFLMVMVPFTPGMKMPEVTSVSLENGIGALINWGKRSDRICFSTGSGIKGSEVQSDASATFIRLKGKKISEWMMLDGTRLTADGKELVKGLAEPGVVSR